jgi:cation diffusion facilitator family transporter
VSRYDWIDDGYFHTESRDIGAIRRVLIITMLLNFIATVVKIGAGVVTGAISVVADGLDSLFDGLSNVIGLAGLYVASKPPDAEHPYGHRKFETVAALSIAFLLFLTCWQLVETSLERLGEGRAPTVNNGLIAAMIISIVIQAGTSYYELRAGRQLNSEILVADALHTRASILVSLSVILGLVFVRAGYSFADPILAIFVALMIAKIGVDILRETLPVLVDRAPINPHQIAAIVEDVSGVESFHRVRSRGARGSAAVDLHVRISPNRSVQEADAIAHEVRRRLLDLKNVTDVTVHIEAQRESSTSAEDIFSTLKHAAEELNLRIHEAEAHRIDDHQYLEVHVGVDPRLTLGEAHILIDQLESELHIRLPEVSEINTHIEVASLQILEDDHVPDEIEKQLIQEVRNVIHSFPKLADPHNIKIRPNHEHEDGYSISLECKISPETPIAEAHQLSSQVEQLLIQQIKGVVDVFVHLEPPG